MKERMTLAQPVRLLSIPLVGPNLRHRACLGAAWLVAGILIVSLAIHGYTYYKLPLPKESFLPFMHP